MSKEKLTDRQGRVLRLMVSGWQLGRDTTYAGGRGFWLQKGGIGRGGESEDVHNATAWGLYNRGLIRVDDKYSRFPTERWTLTNAGESLCGELFVGEDLIPSADGGVE